jgi:hypothetical protein
MVAAKEDPDEGALRDYLDAQDGVISRAQVRACGGGDLLIKRMLRRNEWARLHEGVYVNHTGPPSWRQRAWAAVLAHEPAALAGASALRAYGLEEHRGKGGIHVVVDRSRRVDPAPGVSVSQVADLDSVALLHLSPPRVRIEHAALTVAAHAGSDDAVVAAVAEVVRLRRTTAKRLREALADRPKLRHAALLREVLTDVAVGAESALERRYLRGVERAHGLPVGQRQAPGTGARGRVYRDVEYAEHDALVELDGRLGHESTTDRWADLERDLLALADGRVTLRAGWGQVLQPCRLAAIVSAVLGLRGWSGTAQPCGSGCAVDQARIA